MEVRLTDKLGNNLALETIYNYNRFNVYNLLDAIEDNLPKWDRVKFYLEKIVYKDYKISLNRLKDNYIRFVLQSQSQGPYFLVIEY